MKRAKYLIWVILAIGSCLFAGCGQHHDASSSDSSATNPSNQSDNSHWDQAKADALLYKANHDTNDAQGIKDALAYSDMVYQEKLRHPPTNKEIPLPNYPAGPLHPRPMDVNFYGRNEHYPAYLLCTYDVDEKHYDQVNESGWFKAALLQIRGLGAQKFPPFRWIAIVIKNRAEHKDASTFEQSFKVGAIFKADDVFDSSRDLSQLIAHADMDRHPFKYDPQQPTPGEQQRWVIVEQHAATNPPTTGSK